MMNEVTSILQSVRRGSQLSLALWNFGSSASTVTRDISRVASTVSLFARTLKQVGVAIKEDDFVPSAEAFESIQEILRQGSLIFGEIETIVPLGDATFHGRDSPLAAPDGNIQKWRWTLSSKARMDYLLSHLKSLYLTLSLMLQTFYTAKVIRSSHRRKLLKGPSEDNVQIERLQMETLIVEQQICLLEATQLFDEFKRSEAFDKPQKSLELINSEAGTLVPFHSTYPGAPSPDGLVYFQEHSLVKLDLNPAESDSIAVVQRISVPYVDNLFTKWTRLSEIEEHMRVAAIDSAARSHKRSQQQPTVESEGEEEDGISDLYGFSTRSHDFAIPVPQRPTSLRSQSATNGFPHSPSQSFGSLNAPYVPQATPSPKTVYSAHPAFSANSAHSMQSPTSPSQYSNSSTQPYVTPGQSPISPSSSFQGAFPFRFAPVANTQVEAEDHNALEIPWRLGCGKIYWDYVDEKVKSSNTDLPPSEAYSDRKARTEVQASWVSHEAIEEMNYPYSRVQKSSGESRRTKLETWFIIESALVFKDVQRLVERTIQIYRSRRHGTTLKPPQHPPSFERSYSSPAVQSPSHNYGHLNPMPFPPRQPPYRSSSIHSRSSHQSHASLSGSDSSDYSRKKSKSRSRRNSQGDRSKDRGNKSRTNKMVGTMAKVGGLAALLDGLTDAAGGL